jgi:succinate-semialdehyde dehydrogenase/glutarate-semialdehyde dehydrogenase
MAGPPDGPASSGGLEQRLALPPADLFIGGEWRPSASGKRFAVVNPATEQTLLEVADGTPEDGMAAVSSAVAAQEEWAETAPRFRSDILMAIREEILARTDELAITITLEMGKPLAESRAEVAYAAEFFRWFAEEAVRVAGHYGRQPDGNAHALVSRQPVGPSLLITPWNFPLAMGARKLAPAIAAGCTSVLKPAPQTPLSTLALAHAAHQVGVPAGVVNVVTTTHAPEVVTPMLTSGQIRKLSFTGSTHVGKLLMAQAGSRIVRTSLELGGNAPFIVLEDASMDVAVEAALQAKMRNIGQSCTAANRFLVHEALAQDFSSALAGRMAELHIAPGLEPRSEVGPLIDSSARDKINGLVDDAVHRGARVATGHSPVSGPGYFVRPTVLTHVPVQSKLHSEEIFGPVAAISTFSGDEQALALANSTDWGLVAYVVSQDVDRVLHFAERLQTGMVGVNTGLVSNPASPFGGVRESGLGREGGDSGIEEFLDVKYVRIASRAKTPELAGAAMSGNLRGSIQP